MATFFFKIVAFLKMVLSFLDNNVGAATLRELKIEGYNKNNATFNGDIITYKYTDHERLDLTCLYNNPDVPDTILTWYYNYGIINSTDKSSLNYSTNLLSSDDNKILTCELKFDDSRSGPDPVRKSLKLKYVPPKEDISKTDTKEKQKKDTKNENSANDSISDTVVLKHVEKYIFGSLAALAIIIIIFGIIMIIFMKGRKKEVNKSLQNSTAHIITAEEEYRISPYSTLNLHANNTPVKVHQSPLQSEEYFNPSDVRIYNNFVEENYMSNYSSPYQGLYTTPLPKSVRKQTNVDVNNTNHQKYSNVIVNFKEKKYSNADYAADTRYGNIEVNYYDSPESSCYGSDLYCEVNK